MNAAFSRRLFLAGGVSLSARALPPPKQQAEYAFAMNECDVRVTVEFYDRYSTAGFSFRDTSAGHRFCLSATGGQDHDCAAGFAGSLAIARYNFRPRSESARITALREHVCAIDQDRRLAYRAPFDRTIELREGVASDIQAFGYDTARPSSADIPQADTGALWCYFRQDLYVAGRPTAFLVVHWRHTFSAIRILDVIPGDGTWPVKQTR
jgi:hypothetical protein